MNNEIEIITDEEQLLTTGSFEIKDFEKQKKWLISKTSLYNVKEINEDTIGIAKANKALLNKVAKALDNKRLSAQKAYMEPFNKGKDQYNELISIINEQSNKLKEGIDQLEERYKEDRKKELEIYFNSANSYPISFNQILDSKWLNKTTKIEDAKKAIDDKLININQTIYMIKSSFKDDLNTQLYLLTFYFRSLDFNKSVEETTDFIEELQKVKEWIK